MSSDEDLLRDCMRLAEEQDEIVDDLAREYREGERAAGHQKELNRARRQCLKSWENSIGKAVFRESPGHDYLTKIKADYEQENKVLLRDLNNARRTILSTGMVTNATSASTPTIYSAHGEARIADPTLFEPGTPKDPYFHFQRDKDQLDDLCEELEELGCRERVEEIKRAWEALESDNPSRRKNVCYEMRDMVAKFFDRFAPNEAVKRDSNFDGRRDLNEKGMITWKGRWHFLLRGCPSIPEFPSDMTAEEAYKSHRWMIDNAHNDAVPDRATLQHHFRTLRDALLRIARHLNAQCSGRNLYFATSSLKFFDSPS